MTGYWPRSFFACLWTSTSSRSINTQKKNLANIQSSWPHAWSITHTYLSMMTTVTQSSTITKSTKIASSLHKIRIYDITPIKERRHATMIGLLDTWDNQRVTNVSYKTWWGQGDKADVNVEVVAKHYHPTLLDETFKFKLPVTLKRNRSKRLCYWSYLRTEMMDSNEEYQKWLRKRVGKGMFTARYIRS